MTTLELATQNGFTAKDLQTLTNQLAYRKMYNARPDVVARRKAYTAKRNAKMTALKQILTNAVR
jgi:hypothetical protein